MVRCGFRAVRSDAALTGHILEFLRNRHEGWRCLVLDLDVVPNNYVAFAN
ncbi:MAG: hypothetical protein ACRED2_00560 [Methylocella sp.]